MATNKEIQLRKTCQLYAFVLEHLGHEVPEMIEECAQDFEYPVECAKELIALLEATDRKTLDIMMHSNATSLGRDLANWWQMQKEADELRKAITQTCL